MDGNERGTYWYPAEGMSRHFTRPWRVWHVGVGCGKVALEKVEPIYILHIYTHLFICHLDLLGHRISRMFASVLSVRLTPGVDHRAVRPRGAGARSAAPGGGNLRCHAER